MAKQLLFRACNSPLLAVGSQTASLTYGALLLFGPTPSHRCRSKQRQQQESCFDTKQCSNQVNKDDSGEIKSLNFPRSQKVINVFRQGIQLTIYVRDNVY